MSLRVVVVGSGPAGLAAAAFLKQSACVKAVTVVAGHAADSPTWGGGAVGLWGPALRALQRLTGVHTQAGFRVAEKVTAAGEWVRKSGFTSHQTGEWLLRPPADLPASPVPRTRGSDCAKKASNGSASSAGEGDGLLFLESGILQSILHTELSDAGAGSRKVDVVPGVVTSVEWSPQSQSGTSNGMQSAAASTSRIPDHSSPGASLRAPPKTASVRLASGATIDADLIVGADGLRSTVRESLQAFAAGTGGGGGGGGDGLSVVPAIAAPQRCGYVVFRGVASGVGCGDGSNTAFQAWGAGGSRFAVVPLAGKRAAWFATIKCPTKNDAAAVLKAAGVPGQLLNGRQQADLSTHTPHNPSHSRGVDASGAIFDVSEGYSDYLQRAFKGWDTRVQTLIASTDTAVSGGDGSGSTGGLGAGPRVAAQDAECLSIPYCTTTPQQLPVVLLGDAMHAVDPILAQGAGIAIEDADALATALDAAYRNVRTRAGDARDENGAGVPGALDAATVAQALEAYRHERINRTVNLRWISRVSQGIAMADIFDSKAACNVRDAVLQVADRTVGRRLFGWSIGQALVGGPSALMPLGTRPDTD